jgi:hypothetical protein
MRPRKPGMPMQTLNVCPKSRLGQVRRAAGAAAGRPDGDESACGPARAAGQRPADGEGDSEKRDGVFRQPEHVRFAWIAQQRQQYPLAVLCRMLAVSRSGFYAWSSRQEAAPSPRTKRRDELTAKQYVIRSDETDHLAMHMGWHLRRSRRAEADLRWTRPDDRRIETRNEPLEISKSAADLRR